MLWHRWCFQWMATLSSWPGAKKWLNSTSIQSAPVILYKGCRQAAWIQTLEEVLWRQGLGSWVTMTIWWAQQATWGHPNNPNKNMLWTNFRAEALPVEAALDAAAFPWPGGGSFGVRPEPMTSSNHQTQIHSSNPKWCFLQQFLHVWNRNLGLHLNLTRFYCVAWNMEHPTCQCTKCSAATSPLGQLDQASSI